MIFVPLYLPASQSPVQPESVDPPSPYLLRNVIFYSFRRRGVEEKKEKQNKRDESSM